VVFCNLSQLYIKASNKNFTKIKKFENFKNTVVEKILFVFRAENDSFVGAFNQKLILMRHQKTIILRA
jgi:phosphoribosylamine-glycine ligase